MSKNRASIHLDETQERIAEEAVRESYATPGTPPFQSKAEVYRKLIDIGIEHISTDAEGIEIEELVSDAALVEHERERLKERSKPTIRAAKTAQRFRKLTEDLFSGERGERATPSVIETIAESYLSELASAAEVGTIPDDSVREQTLAIERRVAEYREDYEAARYAPHDPSDPEAVEIGRDIRAMRSSIEEIVATIVDKAESEAFDPDAIVRSVSAQYGVSEEAIEIVLDLIVPEDVDPRLALKAGDGVEFREILPTEPALDSAPEPDGELVRNGGHGTIGIRFEENELEPASEVEGATLNGDAPGAVDVIDGDELRDRIDAISVPSEADDVVDRGEGIETDGGRDLDGNGLTVTAVCESCESSHNSRTARYCERCGSRLRDLEEFETEEIASSNDLEEVSR